MKGSGRRPFSFGVGAAAAGGGGVAMLDNDSVGVSVDSVDGSDGGKAMFAGGTIGDRGGYCRPLKKGFVDEANSPGISSS